MKKSYLHISLAEVPSQANEILILEVSRKVLQRISFINEISYDLNIKKLSAGVYFVKVGNVAKKFVKE